ncbi:phosphoribose diphosphate:decaprenyl-phosphate phosphoribosyltransferase [Bacteroidales bacterium Barb7]|nr:phosphoribose diphosphate:decaprenyl-phosphate phosphoribosyltransferase [Bacteroidales bacterium Barb7]
MIKSLLSLIRIKQWVKNIFVFFPLFFGHRFTDWDLFFNTVYAFISFSLVASAVYCLNDLQDMEEDRLHPKKRMRPLASGAIKIRTGRIFMCVLLCMALFISYIIEIQLFYITGAYFLLNIFYTLKIKQYALLDVFILSTGFILRLYAGSAVTDIILSEWILIMTFLLALFLGFAKRRDDILIYEKCNVQARKNTQCYSKAFIDVLLSIITSVIIVAYIMYCLSADIAVGRGNIKPYITSVFVILGMFRYLQLTMVYERSGSPTELLYKDYPLQLIIAGWIFTFCLILYV